MSHVETSKRRNAETSRTASKPFMRNLGEFFGHVIKAIRTDPARKQVSRTVQEDDRGDVILRRTTVEEIEFKDRPSNS